MTKIMFVCHGNICRSPMAEFVMKKIVEEAGAQKEFFIASSATHTDEIWNGIGSPIYPAAARELERHAVHYDDRRATLLKKTDYDLYDYIIAMDTENIRYIEKITGHRGGKIHLLTEYLGEARSVADPWYTGDFSKAYNDIEKGCNAFFKTLKETKND